jgi:chromosome segregation ATPase
LRRTQNREAQRRFRKRKEDHKKDLEQQISALESKCQELLASLEQKSDNVAQLEKDKEALQSENQDLRKLWQTIVQLMQQLKVLQSLSSLAALLTTSITQPSPSASPDSQKTSASANVADQASITGCLEAFLSLLNDKPHIAK